MTVLYEVVLQAVLQVGMIPLFMPVLAVGVYRGVCRVVTRGCASG